MKFFTSRHFDRKFRSLPKKTKRKAVQQMKIFAVDHRDKRLHTHALHGPFRGHRSIDITGDIRAIYHIIGRDIAEFIEIGSHSELYS